MNLQLLMRVLRSFLFTEHHTRANTRKTKFPALVARPICGSKSILCMAEPLDYALGNMFSTSYESFDPAATPTTLIDVVPWRTRRPDRYQSIADTIVQLFDLCACGVIAWSKAIQSVIRKKTDKEQT